MKALLQRVSEASVSVDGACVGAIGPIASGILGADMQVALVNDGPVTFPLEIVPN